MLYCDVVYSSLSCTIVAVSATGGRSNDTLAIYHTNRLSLSRYRYLQDGAVWHVQPITLDMDPVRGHCNSTRYVVRQVSLGISSAVHSADSAAIRLYSQIASCTWRRRDAEGPYNFQTVNVVAVLSWLWYFCNTVYIFRCMVYFWLCILYQYVREWIYSSV